MTVFPNFVDELEARTRIYDVLARYCRGIDRGDHAYCREIAFHEGATDDHGSGVQSAGEFLKASKARHEHLHHHMYQLGQVLYDFVSPDVAVVETYVTVTEYYDEGFDFRLRAMSDPGPDGARIISFCRYGDIFERRNGEWRIAERVTIFGDSIHEPLDAAPVMPDGFRTQRHGPDDPIFPIMARARERVSELAG
jgi:SnoaL-like domain